LPASQEAQIEAPADEVYDPDSQNSQPPVVPYLPAAQSSHWEVTVSYTVPTAHSWQSSRLSWSAALEEEIFFPVGQLLHVAEEMTAV
jgi:hypothetical protein